MTRVTRRTLFVSRFIIFTIHNLIHKLYNCEWRTLYLYHDLWYKEKVAVTGFLTSNTYGNHMGSWECPKYAELDFRHYTFIYCRDLRVLWSKTTVERWPKKNKKKEKSNYKSKTQYNLEPTLLLHKQGFLSGWIQFL